MSKLKTSQCENKEKVTSSQNLIKGKKVVKIIADVLFYIILALLVVVLICFVVDKFSGEETYPFFGYKGMIVQSNSMAFKNSEFSDFLSGHDEQFSKNDLIFTRKLKDGETPEVYDIVTFKNGNITVIHRIVDIYEKNGTTYYVTRGDAAPTADSAKTIDQITGVYASNWGKVGVIVKFLQSLYGVLAIILCLTIVIIAYVVVKFLKKEEAKKKTANKQNKSSRQNNTDMSDNVECNSSETLEYNINKENHYQENNIADCEIKNANDLVDNGEILNKNDKEEKSHNEIDDAENVSNGTIEAKNKDDNESTGE